MPPAGRPGTLPARGALRAPETTDEAGTPADGARRPPADGGDARRARLPSRPAERQRQDATAHLRGPSDPWLLATGSLAPLCRLSPGPGSSLGRLSHFCRASATNSSPGPPTHLCRPPPAVARHRAGPRTAGALPPPAPGSSPSRLGRPAVLPAASPQRAGPRTAGALQGSATGECPRTAALSRPQANLPVDSHGRGFQRRPTSGPTQPAALSRSPAPPRRPVAPASPTPPGVGTRVTTPAHPPKGGGRRGKKERQECRKPGNHQPVATQPPSPPGAYAPGGLGTSRWEPLPQGTRQAPSGPCKAGGGTRPPARRGREPAGAPVAGRSRRGPTRGWTPQAAPRPVPARPRGPRSPSASPGGGGGRRPSTARRRRR